MKFPHESEIKTGLGYRYVKLGFSACNRVAIHPPSNRSTNSGRPFEGYFEVLTRGH